MYNNISFFYISYRKYSNNHCLVILLYRTYVNREKKSEKKRVCKKRKKKSKIEGVDVRKKKVKRRGSRWVEVGLRG